MKSDHPYDSGKTILVEDCQRITISTYMRKVKEKLKEQILAAEIQLANLTIELIPSQTPFNGTRFWFQCPLCTHKVATLFVHPLTSTVGCRKCLGLEYRSRRYKGMIEAKTCR